MVSIIETIIPFNNNSNPHSCRHHLNACRKIKLIVI
jgi:hypothetical protein